MRFTATGSRIKTGRGGVTPPLPVFLSPFMVWFQDRSLAIYRLFVVGQFIARWIKTTSTQIQKRWLFSGIRYLPNFSGTL